MTVISGDGQRVESGDRFAALTVHALNAEDQPAPGQAVSFYVNDSNGTGTDFHGSSPVIVTTDIDGICSTDVPLSAGQTAGSVEIIASSGRARTTFTLRVVEAV
ncbi:hypothetical protein [Streptomyces alboflavus]|uniref:hypothetical protein n=1 Tax=Streptomyces alboflavus TaxID=67267 RepID=UPI0012FF0D06|nr:hypothetical protein [Streptomyces alboflavus]